MDAMGTQKPLGTNNSITNRPVPNRSPAKRSRARKSFDRIEVKNKERRYKANTTDLDFLNNMSSPLELGQVIQIPNQNMHADNMRNFDLSFHSLNYPNEDFQQNYAYQRHLQDFSSPLQQIDHFNPTAPALPPRQDFNTSMLVLNTSAMNDAKISPLPAMSAFPPFFNPRQARNMPHNEKVERWMENLPIFFEESEGIIHSDCFDTSSDSEFWEEDEFDNDIERPIILTSPVEILFLQQRRITSLIKKAYNTDK